MAEDANLPAMAALLGLSDLTLKDHYVCVFVPSQTRDGHSVDHEFWRTDAVQIMTKLFKGATAVEGVGGWLDEERGNLIKIEKVSMVVSFITDEEWNNSNLSALREFLWRMGRETVQGEIAVLKDGVLGRIRRFEQ